LVASRFLDLELILYFDVACFTETGMYAARITNIGVPKISMLFAKISSKAVKCAVSAYRIT
jgi:hypothetical protein